jgi:hypothetical protein
MAIKELKTRIALKYDSYSAWTTAPGKDVVLLAGELGICHISDTNTDTHVVPTVLFKVGDGTSTFEALPWASAKAADVYNWAKSETVVLDGTTIKFKTGDKVNHTIDLSSFATDAEVETIRSGLDSRITALEGKFTGDNDVQGQLDALDGRLDVIEGADTVEGSVAKALKDAKAYTDTREAAIETAYKAYADQAEADANTYTDGKVTTINAELTSLDGRLDVIEGEGDGSIKKAVAAAVTEVKAYADTAESDAVATAKSYTDTREAAIKTAYEAYADQAEADAKTYVDGKVSTLNAKDQEQDTEIGKKLDKTTYETYIAGKEMSDEALKGYADGVAGTAKSEAIAAAKTETETQISTLVASGQVKTNTDAIAQNKADIAAMDTAYKKAVSDEAKARDDADKALDERLDAVEAFFVTAEGETIDKALDTLVEIQEYLNGDGSATGGIIDRVAQAETDIDNLEKEFNTDNGRVKVAEGKIAALEAADEAIEEELGKKLASETFNTWKNTHEDGHAKSAAEITSEINTAVSGEKSAREAADKAITDAIGTSADGKDVATVYGAIADAKAAGTGAASEATRAHERLDVVEPKVTTLQDLADGYTGKGSIKSAVDAAQKAADDAQDAADKAQGEIDALELVVGNETTGLAAAHTKAGKNASDIAALTTRVTTAEGEIDALQATVDTATTGLKDRMTAAEGKITSLQTLTGDAAKGNEALHTELTRVAGLVDNGTTGLAATKVIADRADAKSIDNANRIKAIEDDYLKEADQFIINCGSASTVLHTAPAKQ